MKFVKSLIAVAATLAVAGTALADITIGVSLPLTGPASGLGIPVNNQLKLWPATIAGEKVKLIILDDATDPTTGIMNAKRFVTDDKADVILGSVATPVAIPMAGIAAELIGGRKHVRQRIGVVGHRIDIEEHRTGNMRGEIIVLRQRQHARHLERCINDAHVRI